MPFRFLLNILSKIYGAITAARNFLYDHKLLQIYTAKIPVISIGNISCGGSGKTPLTLYVASKLIELGYKPVILAKGYKGSIKIPTCVTVQHSTKDVGDEAVLLFRAGVCPVIVSHNKTKGAQFIESLEAGNVIVLDDGFQHRRLFRQIDIVCIDVSSEKAVAEFCTGNLLPLGRLREDRDGGLRRASMGILSHRNSQNGSDVFCRRLVEFIPSNLAVFRSYYKVSGVYSTLDGHQLSTQKVCAFSAIARPEGFFSTLENAGFELLHKESFPDHYQYTKSDIRKLIEIANGLPLVCTEKDLVKLSEHSEFEFFVLKITSTIDNETNFTDALNKAIR